MSLQSIKKEHTGGTGAANRACPTNSTCTTKGCAAPVTFIIFGGTGDLAEKKIFPAIFGLFTRGMIGSCHKELSPSLPSHFENCPFSIVVIGRRPFGTEGIREHVAGALTLYAPHEKHSDIPAFIERIEYHQGSIEENTTFISLANTLALIDTKFGCCSHKLFHFSVAPQLYVPLLEHFEASGLNISCVDSPGKTRAILEKPLGTDAESATTINTILNRVFTKDQIFRIDHYLMKDAIWNMKNEAALLKEVHVLGKSKDDIDAILVRLWETKDVAGRGAFYDRIGALRDVGQNHLLQMIALFMGAKSPSERALSIGSLVLDQNLDQNLGQNQEQNQVHTRGQLKDYRTYQGVNPQSETETLFTFRVHIKGRHMPIIFSSGKALSKAAAEIGFRFTDGSTLMQNVSNTNTEILEGYERAFHDVLCGIHDRFVSEDEIEASWSLIDQVRIRLDRAPLMIYERGFTPQE